MKTEIDKIKSVETSLVLTTFFVIMFFLTRKDFFIFFAMGLGLTGIFIKPVAQLIAKGWFALAHALNFVFSRIILGLIFFIFLTPISIFYRIMRNDKLQLSGSGKSTWRAPGKTYSPDDLKNIW